MPVLLLTPRERLMYVKNFKFSILFIHIGDRKEEMLAYLFLGNIKISLPCPAVCFALFYFLVVCILIAAW